MHIFVKYETNCKYIPITCVVLRRKFYAKEIHTYFL